MTTKLITERRTQMWDWTRNVIAPLTGLVGMLVAGLVYVRTTASESDALAAGGPGAHFGSAFGGPTEMGRYECHKGVGYRDFGTSFEGTTRRECGGLCYSMPDCAAWTLTPVDGVGKGLRKLSAKPARGQCHVYFSRDSIVDSPDTESCLQLSHRPIDIRSFIGVAHWQGCYFKSDLPFLLDGAEQVKTLGAKTIKVSLNFHAPWDDYPWHSDWGMDSWKTWTPDPLEVAKHPYFQQLFSMDNFDTFILVAYSSVARSTGPDYWKAWLEPWYWVYKDPTHDQLKEESRQFFDLAYHLASTYSGKTFILQMWEGDWTLRMDLPVSQHYNASAPVAPIKAERMIKWLRARQDGVTRARRALGESAKSTVYHGGEVNTVRQTANNLARHGRTDRVDMVNAVLPHVALDVVSYSAYDAALADDANEGELWRAIQLVQRAHKRTEDSPDPAVYLGEFGVPAMNTDWDDTMEKVKNALNVAVAANVRHIVYWQLFDNSLNLVGRKKYGVERCDSRMVEHGPVYDQKYIEGFFLLHPDMDYYRPNAAYLYRLMQGCSPGEMRREDGTCVKALEGER